jgi:hypothetical protein
MRVCAISSAYATWRCHTHHTLYVIAFKSYVWDKRILHVFQLINMTLRDIIWLLNYAINKILKNNMVVEPTRRTRTRKEKIERRMDRS